MLEIVREEKTCLIEISPMEELPIFYSGICMFVALDMSAATVAKPINLQD